ncbi:hypothetical protein DDT46_00445 [Mycobacteroides abscessus]|uniref:Bacteriophage protein n=1 Tax=Mycobacteroides abscessus TaxID=36809 RepID=A0ABD7HG78_9MYCO|nr:hypothetical protein [Mycobacteroides abscessus]AWG62442.1 hypothetical protein DDT46_00445 [Mycobacteroides abscessus]RIT28654.1 hypothetical protein D2E76_27340 [Mycobacteroides abscessus]
MANDVPGFLDRINALWDWHSSTCHRCRRTQAEVPGKWGYRMLFNSVPVAMVCPECTTPEEFAECQIRDATTKYIRDGNRWIASPKLIDE